ncbi:MAG: translation initiation factor IF-2 [Phycisphaerae bacterium]|nr:translation initiation factor IF-2 [Phycisphaerae bacterium]MDD5380673.1 translation initiation factor IF-2 [Phycisphaerae bacterium]
MAATRVYILAKELGVKSTAIVKKCQDEGLDVKNHMSWISAGLTATVREWFSEGEHATTVETTEKVDLKKVRLKKKRVTKKGKKPELVEAQAEPEATEQKPAETAVIEEVKPEEVKPVEPPKEQEPEVILPAGPLLEKPEPAKLSGPQVVRVEAPEPLGPPRPRQKSRPRYDAPVTEPLMYTKGKLEEPIVASPKEKGRGPKRHKERTQGRRHSDDDVKVIKPLKVSKWRQRDIEERQARLDAAGGESLRLRPTRKILTKAHAKAVEISRPKKATISEPITVRDLSSVLAVKSADIITKLMQQGVMATANQVISSEVAELVALELGTELVVEHKKTLEEQIRAEFDGRQKNNLEKRSVVAAMLGHVDHGKTSLLDKIRTTKIAAGEAGGITQHIGASQVSWDDKKVTFLDTPGHEAFTAMRARGANMTDVVVLTVAAGDGVMPQTIEAIHHAKAAGVPIIVALNKIDLPGIDFNRVYAQLSEQGLTPVEWGGDTEVVKTSAVTGTGINDLLEHLDYTAELLDLKADNTVPATGWVVEAKMSPQLGPVATLLIKEGRLNKGDVVLAGCAFGRVKSLKDGYGKKIKSAASSMPVEIAGLSDVPQAGDRFYVTDDINRAKAAAEENQMLSRENSLAKRTQVTLDNLFSHIESGKIAELNLIIRADVQGSVDVLTKYLSELSTDEVKVKILHAAPGGITEGDCLLAEASNAIIIGFNVVPEERVAKIAETRGIEIRLYDIIYRITEDLQKSMAGLLKPEEKEEPVGRAVVRTVFKISKLGAVAGCLVSDGIVTRSAKVRLIRDNIVIRSDLTIESLKHFKDDAREVKAGLECGIKIAKFDDIKVDDVFALYEIVKVARTL